MNNTSILENFIFYIILGFFGFLWFANFGNYLILLSFVTLFFVVNLGIKNYKYSLLIVTFVSSMIYAGKSYTVEILPAGSFNMETFSGPYEITASVMPLHIFSVFMLLVIIRDAYLKRISSLKLVNKTNLLLFAYYVLIFIIDILVSRMPLVSFLLDVLYVSPVIIYFYLQIYGDNFPNFFKILTNIFYALTFFESLLIFYQFILKSPVGKTIEVGRGFIYQPGAADEIDFLYRPSGTFDHPNVLALNLCVWLFFMINDFILDPNRRKITIILFGFLGLIITLSRASWVGFLIGLMFILFVIEKVWKVRMFPLLVKFRWLFYTSFILSPLFLIYFVLPRALISLNTFSEGGALYRSQQFYDAWKIIKLNFWTGVGGHMFIPEVLETLNDSIFHTVPYGIHNWYISLLATYGIFSLLLVFTFLFVSITKIIVNIIKSNKLNSVYLNNLSVVAVFLLFLILGVFTGDSGFSYLLLLFGYVNGRKI